MHLHLKWCILLDNTVHICINSVFWMFYNCLEFCTEKTPQSPIDLWEPGERHRPLGPLVFKIDQLIYLFQKMSSEMYNSLWIGLFLGDVKVKPSIIHFMTIKNNYICIYIFKCFITWQHKHCSFKNVSLWSIMCYE